MERSEIDACYFRARELGKRVQEYLRIRESQSKQQIRYSRRHRPFLPQDAVVAVLQDEVLDVLTSKFLISELGRLGSPDAAIALLSWSVNHGGLARSKQLYDAVLGVCALQLAITQALETVNEMMNHSELAPDVTSFNFALMAAMPGGHVQQSEKLLEQMENCRVPANTFTASIVLQTCMFKRRGGHHMLAIKAYNMLLASTPIPDIPEEIVKNVHLVCEASIDGAKSVKEAEAVLAALMDAGLEADTRSYNAMLRACARQKDWQAALNYFMEMGESKVSADTLSFNTLIASCLAAGAIDKALQVFEWVVDGHSVHDSLLADAETYDTLVRTCHQAGMLEKALELTVWAHSTGTQLKASTYEEVAATVEVANLWDSKALKALGVSKGSVLFPYQLRPAPTNDARLLYLSHVEQHYDEELLARKKLGTRSWVPNAFRSSDISAPQLFLPKVPGSGSTMMQHLPPLNHDLSDSTAETMKFVLSRVPSPTATGMSIWGNLSAGVEPSPLGASSPERLTSSNDRTGKGKRDSPQHPTKAASLVESTSLLMSPSVKGISFPGPQISNPVPLLTLPKVN